MARASYIVMPSGCHYAYRVGHMSTVKRIAGRFSRRDVHVVEDRDGALAYRGIVIAQRMVGRDCGCGASQVERARKWIGIGFYDDFGGTWQPVA